MARINHDAVNKFSEKLAGLALILHGTELKFTEEDKFPPVGGEGVIDYLFATTLQNYGFWRGDERGYAGPVYGKSRGAVLKGSDLLMVLSMEAYRKMGPEFYAPGHLAGLSWDEFLEWIPEESGFPDLLVRYELAVSYGRHFFGKNWPPRREPGDIVSSCNRWYKTLGVFIEETSRIPGYSSDPLHKKNLLLAMMLSRRPERFLKVRTHERQYPIVDYHLKRLALRFGLVELENSEIADNTARVWVSPQCEENIRFAVYDALCLVLENLSRSLPDMSYADIAALLDSIMWKARDYCPEMTEPECALCVLGDVCEKRTSLFQPVFRTINY